MAKAFLIDTTVCTGCRGCQIACKQWKKLPAAKTENRGTYQNPEDLSHTTYKLVRMNEMEIDGKLRWLFFPDQCRHCLESPCLEAAGEPKAVYRHRVTGAILYTPVTREIDTEAVIESCPYNIPRQAPDGRLVKCDLCVDRVTHGLLPACVQTCPTGAMKFGEEKDIRIWAKARVAELRHKFPQATLVNPDKVRVIYLTAFEPTSYWRYATAEHREIPLTRAMALRRMAQPLRDLIAGIV